MICEEATRLETLYTPLGAAVAKLHEQQSRLQTTPANELETELRRSPCAVLFRQVATPNFETERFVRLAKSAGLRPFVLEFHDDLFVDLNPMKYALARMTFHHGTGRNGGARNHCLTISDMTMANRKPLREVRTHAGGRVIDFHHSLLRQHVAGAEVKIHDASAWFQSHGGSARLYYPHLFELFIDHAILFETFLLGEHDARFTTEIILPAFERVCAERGRRPLICRLDPPEMEGDPHWLQYPGELLPAAKALLHTAS